MSPNANYISGRAFEYEVMKDWRSRDYACIRASGSHGTYDLVAFRPDRKPEFIQCKRVATASNGTRLIKAFRVETKPSRFYHQVLSVRVKGSREIVSVTI